MCVCVNMYIYIYVYCTQPSAVIWWFQPLKKHNTSIGKVFATGSRAINIWVCPKMGDAPTIAAKNREHTDKPKDLSVPYFQKLARI